MRTGQPRSVWAMTDTGVDLVTGAFSYTGSHIASRLLDAGRGVRTLTGHPRSDHPLAGRVEASPYRFDSPAELARSFEGVTTFYNTYWVRFPRRGMTFLHAVARSQMLFDAAARAGVRRIVHVSIANVEAGSRWPYFQGKALVERALEDSGVGHSIVRPTVVFGGGDVLINNIASLLRRFPVFGLPGRGPCGVRPVHVDDVARLCVEGAAREGNEIVDAVGPESLTFAEMVDQVRRTIGSSATLVAMPPAVIPGITWAIGFALGDVLLTRDELRGLMDNLVTVDGPATGTIALSDWLRDHADTLGLTHASELARHYR